MTEEFAAVAGAYSRCRPSYPDELFAYLGSVSRGHELAWDCGAGSGQATVPLTRIFRHVVATDASRAMLSLAPRNSRILLCVAAAEQVALRAACADLVTVAQALHWFGIDEFYAEVQRVLRPGGVLAVWTYGFQTVGHETIDTHLARFYHETVGPYWAPGRRHVESGYQSLPFPFPELDPPEFFLEQLWTLSELLGYVGTWSATQRYREATGREPLNALESELAQHWRAGARRVRWPVSMRVGRRPA